jgi:hypothetical protein
MNKNMDIKFSACEKQKYHTARKQFKDLIGKSWKQQKLDATISSCFSG